jgi:hypothetical protein
VPRQPRRCPAGFEAGDLPRGLEPLVPGAPGTLIICQLCDDDHPLLFLDNEIAAVPARAAAALSSARMPRWRPKSASIAWRAGSKKRPRIGGSGGLRVYSRKKGDRVATTTPGRAYRRKITGPPATIFAKGRLADDQLTVIGTAR